MRCAYLRRLGVSAAASALLVMAAPGLLGAQGIGNTGADASRPPEVQPSPGSGSGSAVTTSITVERGFVLPGQEDVPASEQLRMPDKITVTTTVGGTGGGPMRGGGQCAATEVTLSVDVQLPLILPFMDPPAPPVGRGGVVAVPTWLWATYASDSVLSSSRFDLYTSCTSSTDLVTGMTWWSPSLQTATLQLNSAPTGTVFWSFGDSEVGSICGGSSGGSLNTLGEAEQARIQHTYCVSSMRGPHFRKGYPVLVSADFLAIASIDSTDGHHEVHNLPVSTANQRRYPVREVQAVLDE